MKLEILKIIKFYLILLFHLRNKKDLKREKGKVITKGKEIGEKGKIAVLGGGDIGFPLIFAGVVMKDLMLSNPELIGFLKTLIIPVFVSIALMYLLVSAQKDKFYPAMPYLTVGCVIGYFVVLLF